MRIKRLCNAKKGFSLIEVIIVVLGLISSYYSYYRNMTDLRIQTIGQNLAQLQLEDIQNLADTVLVILVEGGGHSPNYPTDKNQLDSAIYYSGKIDGLFQIERLSHVILFDSDGISHDFAYGADTVDGMELNSLLMLPSSIVVDPVDTNDPPDGMNDRYTLTLYEEVFPSYEKEIMITDRTPDLSPANKIFNIKITIFWHVNGVEKSITIRGEKNDARSS